MPVKPLPFSLVRRLRNLCETHEHHHSDPKDTLRFFGRLANVDHRVSWPQI